MQPGITMQRTFLQGLLRMLRRRVFAVANLLGVTSYLSSFLLFDCYVINKV